MTYEPTNAERARWAANAVAVFTAETFSGDHPETMHRNDLESAIGDLFCDLMHYARQQGFHTESILQEACRNYEWELLEEELPA